MRVEVEYADVLQNIESVIVNIYADTPDLIDPVMFWRPLTLCPPL